MGERESLGEKKNISNIKAETYDKEEKETGSKENIGTKAIAGGAIGKEAAEQESIKKEAAGRQATPDLLEQLRMTLAHEVRTPLNVILGSTDLLMLSETLTEADKDLVQNISAAARTLKSTVTNLLDYTDGRQGNLTLLDQEFIIEEIIDEIRSIIQMEADEKQLIFEISLSKELPKKLYGDMKKISWVLRQLLSSAVEHTKEGFVYLRIEKGREDDKRLYFEVMDSGSRVYEESQGELIRSLERCESGEEAWRTDGLGLRLTICRQFVFMMGGKLSYDIQYEKGNRFSFELPVKVLDPAPFVELVEPELFKVLLCTDSRVRMETTKNTLYDLNIESLVEYRKGMRLAEEYFTHILIDSQSVLAPELLKVELPYPCVRILAIASEQLNRYQIKKSDRIFYKPITTFMLAKMFNHWEKTSGDRAGCGMREDVIFWTMGIRVLVVDDNEVNLMVVSNMLRQFGIEVDEANSATKAIRKYCNNVYDLVFMDYLMPDLNGIEATMELKKINRPHNAVIIALSANITPEISLRFLKAGASDILAKPLEISQLSKILKRWIEKEAIFTSEDGNANNEEFQRENMQFMLGSVDGLCWEEALQYMNSSISSYMNVLKVSVGNIREQLAGILTKESGMEKRKMCFHSLKGIFSNIGAKKLAEDAKQLEEAPFWNQEENLRVQVFTFCSQAENFVEELEQAVHLYYDIQASTANEQMLTSQEFKELLGKLRQNLVMYEMNDVEYYLDRLFLAEDQEIREKIRQVEQYVMDFNYDRAIEIIDSIT